jgi:HEAT repeats
MEKRVSVLLVVLLLVILVIGISWRANKGRSTGPVYRGMTAVQWELELEQWHAIEYEYFHLAPPKSSWRARLGLAKPVMVLVDQQLVDAIQEPNSDALPVLLELIKARNARVRCIAVYGLSRLAPETVSIAISELRVLASSDTDPDVRYQAESALHRIRPGKKDKSHSRNPLVGENEEERGDGSR